MDRSEIAVLWFGFQPIPGVAFGLNDAVRITAGEHLGELGSVISVESVEPIPRYMIELGSGGGSIGVPESALEPAL